jgi:multidrug efflux system outer membrane protein
LPLAAILLTLLMSLTFLARPGYAHEIATATELAPAEPHANYDGEDVLSALTRRVADGRLDMEERLRVAAVRQQRLADLMEENPGEVLRGRGLTEQEFPPEVPTGLPSALLERRPDIRAAEQNLIAANAIIGVAKAAYFPQISLTGFLGSESTQLSGLFTGPARTWQFVPQITQPIFNAGRIKSNVNLAEAQKKIALVEYEKSIQTAFTEVSNALVEYRQVKEVRAQQELLLTTLQDRSRLAYMRYRGGVDSLLNALDADRDQFTAELSLAQTKRNELLALVLLYKALGGGWQQ